VKGSVALGGDEAGRALIEGAPQQLARVEVEDVVGLESSPDPLQLAHPQMETGGVARQRRDVESPAEVPHKMGRGCRCCGVEFGHRLEYADLIGGAGTTTSQQKSSIGSGHEGEPYRDRQGGLPPRNSTIRRCIPDKNGPHAQFLRPVSFSVCQGRLAQLIEGGEGRRACQNTAMAEPPVLTSRVRPSWAARRESRWGRSGLPHRER
jgi:hypothetical protein